MKKSSEIHAPTKRDIERLLADQTGTILSAVDARLGKSEIGIFAAVDARIGKSEIGILSAVDARFEKSEMRFNRKLDQLMTTLDRFLKRLTDSEDEFIILKKDVNHIKTVLKEKLGVDLR